MQKTYDGIVFPQGDVSFADAYVEYNPSFSGGNVPTTDDNPADALGPPGSSYTSLGAGGRITLRFDDNILVGDGTSKEDLHIFEIGPDVEDTFVEISVNGSDFISVGKVFGSTSSVDIDQYLTDAIRTQFNLGDNPYFRYVRLTDDINEGNKSGATVGADIAAVGAIGTGLLKTGSSGNDNFVGTSNTDIFDLGAGDDTVTTGGGSDTIDGGTGFDRAILNNLFSQVKVTADGDGSVTVVAGKDTLDIKGIERIELNDGTIAFDVDGNAGQAYRLYEAVFDRQPDTSGLGYWVNRLDNKADTLFEVAQGFLGSPEFQSIYGTPETVTNEDFVGRLYSNILNRAGEDAGINFWVSKLAGGAARAEIAVNFSESAENQANTNAVFDDGVYFV